MQLEKSYMTYRATNRREGGFMSCRSRSRKLRTFNYSELETARAAKNCLVHRLLAGGGGGGSQRNQIRPHAA